MNIDINNFKKQGEQIKIKVTSDCVNIDSFDEYIFLNREQAISIANIFKLTSDVLS